MRRKVGPLDKMTDRELDIEHAVLSQRQSADMAAAQMAETAEYAEYEGMRSIGLMEDARGLQEQMGYFDPEDFKRDAFRAGKAKAEIPKRAEKLQAVEAERARRAREVGDVPEDAATERPTQVVARDAVSVPEPKDAPNLATMGWREVQSWKRALDRKILATEAKPGGAASDEYLAAIRQRDEIDNLLYLSLIHISEPTRPCGTSRMPSSA